MTLIRKYWWVALGVVLIVGAIWYAYPGYLPFHANEPPRVTVSP